MVSSGFSTLAPYLERRVRVQWDVENRYSWFVLFPETACPAVEVGVDRNDDGVRLGPKADSLSYPR